MNNFSKLALATLLSSTATTSALAYEKGDFVVRGGYASIVPDEQSDVLSLDGSDVGDLLGTTTGFTTNDSSTLAFSLTYMLSENWGLNTIIAVPPENDIITYGLEPLGVSKLGTVKWVPLILAVQYYIPTGTRFEPYVGVGVNYTYFFDEQTVGSLDDSLFASDTELEVDPGYGWVAQAGVDYRIGDNWTISAAAYYIDLEVDARLNITDTAILGGDATLETSAELNPMVYMLMVGYTF